MSLDRVPLRTLPSNSRTTAPKTYIHAQGGAIASGNTCAAPRAERTVGRFLRVLRNSVIRLGDDKFETPVGFVMFRFDRPNERGCELKSTDDLFVRVRPSPQGHGSEKSRLLLRFETAVSFSCGYNRKSTTPRSCRGKGGRRNAQTLQRHRRR